MLLVIILIAVQNYCLAQSDMVEKDLSKYVLWWQGNGVDTDCKNGMLRPSITRSQTCSAEYGCASLDLTQLNLEENCELLIGLTENSCLIFAPKRKNGIGHLSVFSISVFYDDVDGQQKNYTLALKYNYFEDKKKNWCDAEFCDNIRPWQHLDWQGREIIIDFKKNGTTLSSNAGTISTTVKRITGLQIEVNNNASLSVSKFQIKEDSPYKKASALHQDALKKLEEKDFNSCIEITTKIIDLIGNNADAYKLRANACANLGYWKTAIADYEKSIEYASSIPDSPQKQKALEEVYTMLGWCQLNLGDMEGAYNTLKKGGFQGQLVITENNLDKLISSRKEKFMPLADEIKTEIIISLNNNRISSNDIFNKYNNAVFMVLTRSSDGTSQGSGFFIGKNGIAISNYHVFEGAIRGQEQVKLMNGGTYNVKEILGYDKEKDYIIFRVEGNGFTYIPVTKRGYEIGDEVYAIGSPKGMANTLSNGLISQKWDEDHMQISVPIDHGSSGGALINQYGEVIGITSGGRDDSHANLNYAIDIRTIFNDNK